jgi:hypothetical protein
MLDHEYVTTDPAQSLAANGSVHAQVTVGSRAASSEASIDVVVEMGESRTPRPEPFAWNRYERVR